MIVVRKHERWILGEFLPSELWKFLRQVLAMNEIMNQISLVQVKQQQHKHAVQKTANETHKKYGISMRESS